MIAVVGFGIIAFVGVLVALREFARKPPDPVDLPQPEEPIGTAPPPPEPNEPPIGGPPMLPPLDPVDPPLPSPVFDVSAWVKVDRTGHVGQVIARRLGAIGWDYNVNFGSFKAWVGEAALSRTQRPPNAPIDIPKSPAPDPDPVDTTEIVNIRREGNIWQWSRGGVDYYYKASEQELFIKQSDGSFVRVDRWTSENAAMVDRVGAVIHGQV